MAETFPYPAEDRLYAGGLLPRQAAIPYQFLDFINHAFVFLPPTGGSVCSRLGWHFLEGFGCLDSMISFRRPLNSFAPEMSANSHERTWGV